MHMNIHKNVLRKTGVIALISMTISHIISAGDINSFLKSANIEPQNIEKTFTPNIPAWRLKQSEILFDLDSGKKF